ncbi:hypothetical protein MES4922_540035 [Mesorhizobium ventifaucium]|uniref:Uncharacterized protein n=1 Tax=Mesorhizobium ventifaucium TaxID=666020 RepID=A0ABN8K902_9HYPH|nr:hypothetical protein MES4922_540035 [Mesorhizobium ventifaucium]
MAMAGETKGAGMDIENFLLAGQDVRLERRASNWTHKVRSSTLNLRIVPSENRFRFSGRCDRHP